MPTHRQWVVEVPTRTRGNGSSDTESLKTAYPGSPLYNNVGPGPAYTTDEAVKTFFEQQVIDGVVDDGGHTFGTFNRDYVDSPDLNEVEVGGGGLPGSPYAPNIASPSELGQNPTDIPAAGAEVTQDARGSGGPFQGNGLASPKEGAVNISRQRIRTLVFGSSEPTS